MILDILAEFKAVRAVSFGGLLVILVCLLIFALIVIGLIRLVRYLGTAGRERKLLRLEVGKLADELEQVRKQKDTEGGNSGAQSG